MIFLRACLVFLLCSLSRGHFIDEGDHKRDLLSGHSHAKMKRASGEAKFHYPWANTDWNALGKKRIKETIENVNNIKNVKQAKNVILFIGDGMGLQTTSATRVFKSQKYGLSKEEIYLSWEKMPFAGLIRTYNVDRITPDSAGTGTAYQSGVKANYKTLGVNENVQCEICKNMEGNEVDSVLHKSIRKGKATGIVTTTRITHASPAAAYCSSPSRYWEAEVPLGAEACTDIASQLIFDDRNQDIRVLFGGGEATFIPESETNSWRKDEKNLIQEWEKRKQKRNASFKVLRNKRDLEALDTTKTDFAFGLFESSNMNYEMDRDPKTEPSLAEMTAKAIEILQKDEDGFFLFVEGGRIDQAHHANMGQKALEDTLAFDRAISKAMEMVDLGETLIIVSADHSHTFSVSGYAPFEENILGFGDFSGSEIKDGKPVLQMGYINGPGALDHRYRKEGDKYYEQPRKDLKHSKEIYDKNFRQDAGVWTGQEHHGAEDVGVYATGPWAHLFQSTEEQSYIAHVMMYASCVGEYSNEEHCSKNGANKFCLHYILLLIVIFFSF